MRSEIGAVRITRRRLLKTGAALGVALTLGQVAASAASPLDRFMAISREATGFSDLDRTLGQRYFLALRQWEPELDSLLKASLDFNVLSPKQSELVDLVIESWYSGAVPTPTGTRVLDYSSALGQRCLPRSTPVTSCLKA